MGFGIGIENVMILRFIKEYFPTKIGALTSLFTSTMSIMSGIGAWISVKLFTQYGWDWRIILSIWIFTAFIALLIWLIQMRLVQPLSLGGEKLIYPSSKNRANKLHLIIYMGMQSFLFYCAIAWLPSIVQSSGANANYVGSISFLLQIMSIPAGFIFPILAQKMVKPERLILMSGLFLGSGISILLAAPSPVLLYTSVILIGFGLGSSFSMGMVLINIYASNPAESSSLAGRSLMFGYLFASVGPILIGLIYDRTFSWNIPIYIFLIAVFIMVFYGLRIRNRTASETI